MNIKQRIKKEAKFATRIIFGAMIVVIVAGTSIWALAAFSEPTVGPSSSVQDWAKNIMGANNADNAFDSSSVVANSDGSIVERLENLENKSTGVTAISARSSSTKDHYAAAQYCFNLSATAEVANTGSNTSTTYTDWRLGSISEMAVFERTVYDSNYLWTGTPYEATDDYWLKLQLFDGHWDSQSYNYGYYVRCVR